MRLVWARRAGSDRRLIFEYLFTQNEGAAIKFDKLFDTRARQLTYHPRLGRLGRVSGTRELVIEKYILIYDVRPETIRILRIYHAARQWP